ncbi:hypothetical protein BZL39_B03730 [Zygosaccharomyces parabailii]|nr:hypothetical protein BZL39_B03730 [Zygosaccharomyces parabailii]
MNASHKDEDLQSNYKAITVSSDVELTSKDRNFEPQSHSTNTRLEVPDGGYGWFVVLAFFIYNFCTWGANAGYDIYLQHYLEADTFPGGGKLDYSAIGGFSFGVGVLFGPLIIWLQNVFPVQAVIGAGIVFQAAALILAAFSKKLWQIYLTQGVLLSFGLAFIFIPSLTLLPQWFRKKRSLATGIATSGSGVGGVIFNLGMYRMIEIRSVKWALIVQFIICLVLNNVALLLTRTRKEAVFQNSNIRTKFFDKKVCKNVGVWLVIGWVGITTFGYVVVLYSLSTFTTSIGYSAKQGSYVSCMVAVGWFFGRPAIGHISDRYGPISVGVLVHLILAILCWAMWIPCRNLATAIAFGILQGLLMGTIWTTIGAIVARVVGLRRMGLAFGLVWVSIGAFGIVSPIIGLVLRSGQGTKPTDFKRTCIFAGFGYFGASLFQWLLRGYIIARDRKIERNTGAINVNEDQDELDVSVKITDLIRSSFILRNVSKKV